MEKETKQIIPTETKTIQLVQGLNFFRRLRQHGTRSEQFIVQLPTDCLDIHTDTGTNKRFRIRFGYENDKRIIVVYLDDFVFPNFKQMGGLNE
jgi:hypothetical protein